jgi:hypothetical protein
MRQIEAWHVYPTQIKYLPIADKVYGRTPTEIVHEYVKITNSHYRLKITRWGRDMREHMFVCVELKAERSAWSRASLLGTLNAWAALDICGANASVHQFDRALRHVLKQMEGAKA